MKWQLPYLSYKVSGLIVAEFASRLSTSRHSLYVWTRRNTLTSRSSHRTAEADLVCCFTLLLMR